MKIAAVMIAALAVGALACDDRCQWAAWKAQYSKTYTAVEEEHRFQVFRANVAKYARRNAQPEQTAVYGPDGFSDLTREEFSALYLMPGGVDHLKRAPEREAPEQPHKRADLPSSFVSPYTTTARQQGTCGSCWAFASGAVIEGALIKATGTREWVSTQNMLDCADYGASNYNGCRGYRYDAMLGEIAEKGSQGGGLMLEKNYGYTGRMSTCKHRLSDPGDVTVTSYFTERITEAEGSGIYSRLMKSGPLAVALNAGNLDGYTKGIVQHDSNCLYTATHYYGADHAVTLVGWGVENGHKYWVIKNSWSSNWGEAKDFRDLSDSSRGYFRIQRGVGACHLTDSAASGVTVAGSAAPSSDGPHPCVPRPKSKACGTRKCGAVDNGCGNPITCGYCSGGEVCSAGQCSVVDNEVDWVQVSPAGSSDFVMSKSSSGVTIETSTATSAEKKAMWKTSGPWMNEWWTSFSAFVKADAAGVFGLGLRMGQQDGNLNGVSWKISVPSYDGSADFATGHLLKCFFRGGSDQCTAAASFSIQMRVWHNLTLNFGQQMQRADDIISMRVYINGRNVLGNSYHGISRSVYPSIGSAFIVASGAGKHFRYPKIRTRTTVRVAMKSCHTADEWAAEVVRILQVPPHFVVDVSGARSSGSSCGGQGQYDGFNVTLLDSNATIGILGQAVAPTPAGGVDQLMFSHALAEQLTQTVAGGGLENMGIAGATAEVVAPTLAEELVASTIVAAGTGAALSTGAIVGIAVGGAAAVAVGAAAVGAGVYVVAKRKGRDSQGESDDGKQSKKKAPSGVDVMSNTSQHQSITGRAPPVSV
eukprot:m51a1_g1863 hypothetical protein (816) ;mRNA; f:635062-637767